MKFKAGGVEWTAPQVAGAVNGNVLAIIGTDASFSNSLTITVPSIIAVGKYKFDAASNYLGVYVKNTSKIYAAQDGGTLEITEPQGNTIKGIFSFTAGYTRSREADGRITEASFSLSW